ncbi:MAG: 50S ribosomal protein L18 [Bacillota bacterium]
MLKREDRNFTRKRRHLRVRKKVAGTAERPRLSVFRSSRHIYAQVIADETGETLAAASTMDPEIKGLLKADSTKRDAAGIVGEVLGRRAQSKGVTQVVFDRGGYLYHGRVAALAEGARKSGLVF